MRGQILAAAILVLTSGCLTPEAVPEAARPTVEAGVLLVGDSRLVDGRPLLFSGELVGPDPITSLATLAAAQALAQPLEWGCAPDQCEAREVQVQVPDDWWQAHEGFLEVGVRTNVSEPYDDGRTYNVAIMQDGKILAYGTDAWLGAAALLPNPRPGNYTAVVRAAGGSGPYEAVIQLESRVRDTTDREILPNLVVLTPRSLSVQTPCTLLAPDGSCLIGGSNGCYTEEIENGAERCLRFSNMVANLGDGPLDMYMEATEATAATTADARFYQRVHRTGGGVSEEQVGTGFFHPHHAHMHYAQMAEYAVYAIDPDTGGRGEQVGAGRKVGFCLGDYGYAMLGLNGTWAGQVGLDDVQDCAAPSDGRVELYLNPHWFDPYGAGLMDQYVEIGGLPDGTYELVSRVNPASKIRETDVHDNEASVYFALAGDDVKALDGWSQGLCKVGGSCGTQRTP